MKTCPFCAEQIQDAAILCRYCGHDLRVPVAPPEQSQSRPEAQSGTGLRPDWRTGTAFVAALCVSVVIYKLIMDRFLDQSINLFDSIVEMVFAFYNMTIVASGVGFTIGGFLAGNWAAKRRSKWIGVYIGLGYAGWVTGKYLTEKGSITQEMLTIAFVILAASAVGSLVGSAVRGAPWVTPVLISVGVIVILALPNGRVMVGNEPAPASQPAQDISAPTATPVTNNFGSTSVVPCVGLMSKDMQFVASGVQVTGMIKNLCELPIERIRFMLKIYDTGNQVINTVYGYADSDVISPGQSSTFTVKAQMPKRAEIGYTLLVDQAEWAK